MVLEKDLPFLRAFLIASLICTITRNTLRKNTWLDVLDVKGAIEGNCRSQAAFTLVDAVMTTLSFVNLLLSTPFEVPAVGSS